MAAAPVRRLDPHGDLTFGRGHSDYLTGKEATQQRLVSRLRLVLGEWFLNIDAGIPWWQVEGSEVPGILGGKPNLAYIEGLLKDTILGTDGIASLLSFTMVYDGNSRKLTVAAEVVTDDGETIALDEALP